MQNLEALGMPNPQPAMTQEKFWRLYADAAERGALVRQLLHVDEQELNVPAADPTLFARPKPGTGKEDWSPTVPYSVRGWKALLGAHDEIDCYFFWEVEQYARNRCSTQGLELRSLTIGSADIRAARSYRAAVRKGFRKEGALNVHDAHVVEREPFSADQLSRALDHLHQLPLQRLGHELRDMNGFTVADFAQRFRLPERTARDYVSRLLCDRTLELAGIEVRRGLGNSTRPMQVYRLMARLIGGAQLALGSGDDGVKTSEAV
jgi:hypothetical protein